jgi:hypothetical protein
MPVFAVAHTGFAELGLGLPGVVTIAIGAGIATAAAACLFRSFCEIFAGANFSSEERATERLDFLDEDACFIISFMLSFLSPAIPGRVPHGFGAASEGLGGVTGSLG